MRRIDKDGFRATNFQQELVQYEQDHNENHPNYDASAFRNQNYTSVYFALLICQEGICAYTESELYRDYVELENGWQDGIYDGVHQGRIGFRGTIDHFDHNLKNNRGWQLDNLFVIQNDINTDKGTKRVFPFMNPGTAEYAPDSFLFYSFAQHKFYPKANLPQGVTNENVQEMIDTLGLNASAILSERKGYLMDFKTDLKFGTKTFAHIKEHIHYKFFTAFEMSEAELQGD